MSVKKDELDNQSMEKPDSTGEDFELSELEVEQVAGGAIVPTSGGPGSENICGGNLQGACG